VTTHWTNSTPYNDIRNSLKTGDVVLFSGRGLASWLIQQATRSRWSHVGMVVRIPEYDMVLLWESTLLSNVADVEAKKLLGGVQLAPLSARIASYSGQAAIRRLNAELMPEDLVALHELRHEITGRPYERDPVQLWRSALDVPGTMLAANAREDLSSVFCSEMVAAAFQRMKLLPDDVPSNEFTPKDFGQGKLIDSELLRGATLGVEEHVTV